MVENIQRRGAFFVIMFAIPAFAWGQPDRNEGAHAGLGLRYVGGLAQDTAAADLHECQYNISFAKVLVFSPTIVAPYLEQKAEVYRNLDSVLHAAGDMGLILCVFATADHLRACAGTASIEDFIRETASDLVARCKGCKAVWAWQLLDEDDVTAPPESASWAAAFADSVRKVDASSVICTSPALLVDPLLGTADVAARLRRPWTGPIGDGPNDLVAVRVRVPDSLAKGDADRLAVHKALKSVADSAQESHVKTYLEAEIAGAGASAGFRGYCAVLNLVQWNNLPLCSVWTFEPAVSNETNMGIRTKKFCALSKASSSMRGKPVDIVRVGGTQLAGCVTDNSANVGMAGSGFWMLCHERYPGVNLFRDDFVGLNFEHIFNGARADNARAAMTPRGDPVTLIKNGAASVSLHWPAATSKWNIDCDLRYTLSESSAVDIDFETTLHEPAAPLGYVGMMWASYMAHVVNKGICFYGTRDGVEQWVSFGNDWNAGVVPGERMGGVDARQDFGEEGALAAYGTVGYAGAPELRSEEDASTLNVLQYASARFLRPFYYGLVDGDGDYGTKNDTMAFIMMFDDPMSVRFACWNSIATPDGKFDPHSVAWDWQFIIRNPVIGQKYSHRARLVYKPFVSRDDVTAEYERWAK